MGLDNLDQNYFDPNFPGDNHPWGDNVNFDTWKQEQMKIIKNTPKEERLVVLHDKHISFLSPEESQTILQQNKKLKSILQDLVNEFQPMKILDGHKKAELISEAEKYLKTLKQ